MNLALDTQRSLTPFATAGKTTGAAAAKMATEATGSTSTADLGSKMLGVEDFLELLTAQLSNQDPMEPMKDTEFISQMSSFTSLEQMKNLSATLTDFTNGQSQTTAQLYLGKQVSWRAEDGSTRSGLVSGVDFAKEGATLTIDGQTVPVASVLSVRLPASAS